MHEARAVSRLTHPHIVPVFEADTCDGQPYLVFEYVEGPTLREALETADPGKRTPSLRMKASTPTGGAKPDSGRWVTDGGPGATETSGGDGPQRAEARH